MKSKRRILEKLIFEADEGEISLASLGIYMKSIKERSLTTFYNLLISENTKEVKYKTEGGNKTVSLALSTFKIDNIENVRNSEELEDAKISGKINEGAVANLEQLIKNNEFKSPICIFPSTETDQENAENKYKGFNVNTRQEAERQITIAAKCYVELKKYRLIYLKVKELTGKLKPEKLPFQMKAIKTIKSFLTEINLDLQNNTDLKDIIVSFIQTSRSQKRNPFQTIDQLLFDIFDEDNVKKIIETSRKLHDLNIETLKYLKAATAKKDAGLEDPQKPGEEKQNKLTAYYERISKKITNKKYQDDNNDDISDKVRELMDELAKNIKPKSLEDEL